MNKSEQINELAKALAKAQGNIRHAAKDSANPFFKSKYADLASVWAAIRDAFAAEGLAVAQCPAHTPDGLFLETVLMHQSGQWISSVVPLNPVKNDPQGIGSAITYMRRYALQAIAGVCADDDDAEAAQGRAHPAPPAQAPRSTKWTPEQTAEYKRLEALVSDKKWLEEFKHKYAGRVPSDIIDALTVFTNQIAKEQSNAK